MNFVAQVEEHLRDLGTDARRKHPGKHYLVTIMCYLLYVVIMT
jgi:hypothetical protein